MSDCPDAAVCQDERPQANGPDMPMRGRLLLRVALVCVVLAGALAVVYCSPVRSWLQDAGRLRQSIAALGIWGYPACVLAVAILVGCGVPRLLFCAIGGMILGFWWGLLLVAAGTTVGYYAVFLFVRWGGREWVLHRWPKLRKWAQLIHEQGIVGVMLVRQLPIHGTLVNLCLGLSHAKHRHFLIGTIIGLLPEAIPVTLVGTGLVKASLADSAKYLAIAAIAFGLVWIVCGYTLRILRGRRASPQPAIAAEDDIGRDACGRTD